MARTADSLPGDAAVEDGAAPLIAPLPLMPLTPLPLEAAPFPWPLPLLVPAAGLRLLGPTAAAALDASRLCRARSCAAAMASPKEPRSKKFAPLRGDLTTRMCDSPEGGVRGLRVVVTSPN